MENNEILKVLEVKEHEDGSATISFDINSEALRMIIENMLRNALVSYAEELEQETIAKGQLLEGLDDLDRRCGTDRRKK